LDFYELVRGPLAMLSFVILIFGIGFRLFHFYTQGTNPKMLYPKENLTQGFRSIITGIIPFATRFMRERPLFTIVTVLFHASVLLVPLFFMAHIVLWFESYGIVWFNISNALADTMSLFVLFACVFFFIRRLTVKEVKMVSQTSDYIVLIVIFTCFLTGFLAFHQWGPYRPMLIGHILSSEILIAMVPFSRLWHMVAYPFSRYYMGTDFGGPLKAQDW